MNKPLPIECLRKWAGAWLGEQRGLITHATDARPRDIGPTRSSVRCSIALNAPNHAHNLSTGHEAHTNHLLTILGILRGVGYGLRAFAFRPTSLAAGGI